MRALDLGPISKVDLATPEPLFEHGFWNEGKQEIVKGIKLPSRPLQSVTGRLMGYLAFPENEELRTAWLQMIKSAFFHCIDITFEDDAFFDETRKKYGEEGVRNFHWIEGFLRRRLHEVVGKFPSERVGAHFSTSLEKAYKKGFHASRMAGFMLSLIRGIDFHHRDEVGDASLNKVVHLLETQFGDSRSELMAMWSGHKSVAHLAAAYFDFYHLTDTAAREANGDSPNWGELYGPLYDLGPCIQYLGGFLSVARDYQEFGLRFKPAGSKTALLDPEKLWHLQKYTGLREELGPPLRLAPAFLECLKSYRAPKAI